MEEPTREPEEQDEPVIDDPLNPVRQPNEQFWAYKMRMKHVNKALKMYSRGTLVWKSKEYGTYVKPIKSN